MTLLTQLTERITLLLETLVAQTVILDLPIVELTVLEFSDLITLGKLTDQSLLYGHLPLGVLMTLLTQFEESISLLLETLITQTVILDLPIMTFTVVEFTTAKTTCGKLTHFFSHLFNQKLRPELLITKSEVK